jgi:tRNA threonylcarbamoyl adenosine modification protein YeaZ|tara:strand:+ start:430 stop:1134 length:705 start_codon:yes stop_codon:yes gene_type:complete
MYKLSISTSGEYISVAIFEKQLIASSNTKSVMGSTSLLIDQVDDVFNKAKLNKEDLSAVYLDIGPGYYTGLRIGYSVAQGICATLGIPLVPVEGFDALAFSAHTSHRKICTLIDIKRGEFAYCTFRPVPGGVVRENDPLIVTEQVLKDKLSDDSEKKLLVGNWNNLTDKTRLDDSNTKLATPIFVSAENIFEIGERKLISKEFPNFNGIEINYMRDPDITLSKGPLIKEINFYD